MSIKAATLAVVISCTNGVIDTALTRAITFNKVDHYPPAIKAAVKEKINDVLSKLKVGDTAIEITEYVPKVEVAK